MRKTSPLPTLAAAALFAAAIAVTTAYILHIPAPTGGYFHIGDALIYLCASLLPLPWAMAAGAVGGALADLLTAPMWALPTLAVKALICLPFTARGDKLFCRRNALAVVVSGLVSPTLYALAAVLFAGTWAAFLPQFLVTLAQGVASGAIFLAAAWGLDKTGLKRRLPRPS